MAEIDTLTCRKCGGTTTSVALAAFHKMVCGGEFHATYKDAMPVASASERHHGTYNYAAILAMDT